MCLVILVADGRSVQDSAKFIFGEYISGGFNRFHLSEEDAIASCQEPGNGAEFNGQWFQAQYSTFKPGDLIVWDGRVLMNRELKGSTSIWDMQLAIETVDVLGT